MASDGDEGAADYPRGREFLKARCDRLLEEIADTRALLIEASPRGGDDAE